MLTEGREDRYLLPWYGMMSARDGVGLAQRRFLPFYQRPGGMRAGFRHYETMIEDGRENRQQLGAKLPVSTLVLSGERGIPQAQTLASVQLVAERVEPDVVPDAGHIFASDNPEWTAARLIRFFDDAAGEEKTA